MHRVLHRVLCRVLRTVVSAYRHIPWRAHSLRKHGGGATCLESHSPHAHLTNLFDNGANRVDGVLLEGERKQQLLGAAVGLDHGHDVARAHLNLGDVTLSHEHLHAVILCAGQADVYLRMDLSKFGGV